MSTIPVTLSPEELELLRQFRSKKPDGNTLDMESAVELTGTWKKAVANNDNGSSLLYHPEIKRSDAPPSETVSSLKVSSTAPSSTESKLQEESPALTDALLPQSSLSQPSPPDLPHDLLRVATSSKDEKHIHKRRKHSSKGKRSRSRSHQRARKDRRHRRDRSRSNSSSHGSSSGFSYSSDRSSSGDSSSRSSSRDRRGGRHRHRTSKHKNIKYVSSSGNAALIAILRKVDAKGWPIPYPGDRSARPFLEEISKKIPMNAAIKCLHIGIPSAVPKSLAPNAETLRSFFSNFGDVKQIAAQIGDGFYYVEFKTRAGAEAAYLATAPFREMGRVPLKVGWAHRPMSEEDFEDAPIVLGGGEALEAATAILPGMVGVGGAVSTGKNGANPFAATGSTPINAVNRSVLCFASATSQPLAIGAPAIYQLAASYGEIVSMIETPDRFQTYVVYKNEASVNFAARLLAPTYAPSGITIMPL